MIMIADMSECKMGFAELAKELAEMGEKIGMTVRIQHADIFDAMHNI